MPAPDGLLDRRRVMASARLAPYVHHFWSVRWALRSPFRAETLPYPSAQILHREHGGRRRAEVIGVHTGRLSRRLIGDGRSSGSRFGP